MATIGSTNLTLVNDRPEVEVLWNGRYRLTFFCDNGDGQTDWYNENKGEIFPAFGTLQSVQLGEEGKGDWSAPDGSVYDNMRLIEAGTPFIPSVGKHYVKLVYETLTAAYVAEKDEDIDFELNGLQRVSRTFVALPDAPYTNVVGTATITSGGDTLFLGAYKIEKTDAMWSLTETWLEAGELSREENFEDGKGSITITQIGGCPATPEGFTPVNESKNNTQGFETCTITFYEDDSVLSRSNDYVGSQLAEVIEVFNPSVAPTPTNGGKLANQSVSNVDGIPTTRYTFLVPSVLSESEDKVGSQLAKVIEAFDETPATPAGYSLANTQVSDVEGIVTNRYTFLKPSILSESTSFRNQNKLEIRTIVAFNEVPATPSSFTLINTSISDVEGIPTNSYVFAKGAGQVFVSESAGPNNIPGTTRRTIRAFGVALIPNGVLIDSQDILRDGYVEYIRTTLDGTITGIKFQYPDVATVEVPGTVACTTQAVSEDDVSGTIAITNSTPRRQKQVATTVTVKIDTSMPVASPRAYDLGDISCSVTSVQTKLQSGDGSFATVSDGGTTSSQVGYQKSFASSASIQHYIGSYLTTASSSGSVSYQSSEQPYQSGSNAISVQTAFSSASSSCTGTGATSAAGYFESGIIARNVTTALTALDGTTYYQITTEETA